MPTRIQVAGAACVAGLAILGSTAGGAEGTSACTGRWAADSSAFVRAGSLLAVTARTPTDVWAVGSEEDGPTKLHPLIEHWDGVRWRVVTSPAVKQGQLVDVAAVSSTDVWAVGLIDLSTDTVFRTRRLLEHWNGKRWAVVSSVAADWWRGVSATAAGEVWTIGAYDADWTDRTALVWRLRPPPPALLGPRVRGVELEPEGVAVISRDDIWIVGAWTTKQNFSGGDRMAMHWDGRRWRVFRGLSAFAAREGDSALHGVAVVSSRDVWAVGEDDEGNTGSPVINHWDGTRWTLVDSPLPGALMAVAAVSSREVWAVGVADTEQFTGETIGRWDGRSWKPVRGADSAAGLSGVAAARPADVWAVGRTNAGAFAEHFAC